ncbi:MAG: hypothetical protein NT116_05160, partial [Candidatus Parcubacteria bacterium]|nr:hypothetical protein [Candidatus Parcubacteria bacterium]
FIISSILSGYFVIFIFFLPFVSQGKDFQEVIVGYAVFTIFLIFTLIFTIFSMIFNYGIDFVIDLIKKELSI